jgi:hypothetical protein
VTRRPATWFSRLEAIALVRCIARIALVRSIALIALSMLLILVILPAVLGAAENQAMAAN